MATVYIVVASGGDYDSTWQENLSAWLDKTAAELEVLRLQEQTKRLMAMIDQVRVTYYDTLKANQLTLEKMPPVPRAPAKPNKENSAAHQAAMSAYKKLALPIAQRNEAKQLAAMDAARDAAKQKAMELGAVEDDLKVMGFEDRYFSPYCRDADASYEIEELELR